MSRSSRDVGPPVWGRIPLNTVSSHGGACWVSRGGQAQRRCSDQQAQLGDRREGDRDGKGTWRSGDRSGYPVHSEQYETSYADGFIIVNMWDENGRAYMASIPTEDALRMATYIHGIAVDELEGEAAEGAL